MKKKIMYTFILSLFIMFKGYAQENKVKISGRVDTSIIHKYSSDEITFRLRETTSAINSGQAIKTKIESDGSFEAEILLTDSLTYISFEFEDKSLTDHRGIFKNISEPLRKNSLMEVYLFQKGDNINISIMENGNLSFSGKGSEKLNCQWEMYNISPVNSSFENRALALRNAGSVTKDLTLLEDAITSAIQMRLLILKSYKQQLNPDTYSILHIDAVSSAQSVLYDMLQSYPLRNVKDSDRILIKNFCDSVFAFQWFKDVNSVHLTKSAYYVNTLYLKESDKVKLSRTSWFNDQDLFFNTVLDNLKTSYTGSIRDKILLICFENLVERYSEQAKNRLAEVMKIVQNKKYQIVISNMTRKKAYPFKLYDEKNTLHELKDYEGRLVIMEFWFTGCSACRLLSTAMHPIFEKYKDNKKIVFMTVGTDQDDLWKKSISSGLYSSKGMINLRTSGKGFSDPLISYYNFSGFPQLLIIGKKGNLISSSPPQPRSKENAIAFVQMIEENL